MAASRDQHTHTHSMSNNPTPLLPLLAMHTHTHVPSPHEVFVVSWSFAGCTLSPCVIGFGFFLHCRLALSAFPWQWFLWKQGRLEPRAVWALVGGRDVKRNEMITTEIWEVYQSNISRIQFMKATDGLDQSGFFSQHFWAFMLLLHLSDCFCLQTTKTIPMRISTFYVLPSANSSLIPWADLFSNPSSKRLQSNSSTSERDKNSNISLMSVS